MTDESRAERIDSAMQRKILLHLGLTVAGLVLMAGVAVAQSGTPTPTSVSDQCQTMQGRIQSVSSIVVMLVLAVAVPNAAYGVFEYMTAGSSVDQDEKGRRRVRHTIIAVGAVAFIKGIVELVAAVTGAGAFAC
jgi:uncharacterized membrane protein YidH (DUF202 family)